MDSEQLKPEEFDAHIEHGTCRIAFVGMSNSGKSRRSRTLHDGADFLWYEVDKGIEEELGLHSIEELARWLNYPTSSGYKVREREYLELENKFTQHAAMRTGGKNLVFDTTGSVVHLKPRTIHTVRENCLIVHLDIGEDSLEHILQNFFKDPKPVIWAGHFKLQRGESEEAALRRSYPGLLEYRLKKYRALAHVNIPAFELRDKSAKETLAAIRARLG